MTEIIRLTTQMQPLEVGVPLYPFSHASLFQKDSAPAQDPTSAPLPLVAQPYESTSPPPPSGGIHTVGGMGADRLAPDEMSGAMSETLIAGWTSQGSMSQPASAVRVSDMRHLHPGHHVSAMPTMGYAS